MNILINSNRPLHIQSEKDEERKDSSLFGERLAAIFLIFYTSSALLISAVSVLVLQSGIDCGGPLEHFMKLLISAGIV